MKLSKYFSYIAALAPCLTWCLDLATIEQAVVDLDQYRTAQQTYGLQDPNVSYAIRKGLVIADLIVDETGALDLTACQQVQPYFILENPEPYEQNIQRLLNQFDASWQSQIGAIVKPIDPTGFSQFTLKASLGIPYTEPLTDRHARVAVLAALFAPYARPDTPDQQSIDLQAVADYAELLLNGYLRRTINDKPDNYFYSLNLADRDTQQVLTFDAQGNVIGANYKLLDAPGFRAVIRALGGDLTPSFLASVVQFLTQGSVGTQFQANVTQIIRACATTIANPTVFPFNPTNATYGRFVFTSLTQQPLVLATQYVYAAMAENNSHNSIRAQINACVAAASVTPWTQLGAFHQIEPFRSVIMKLFDDSYRLVYDPAITYGGTGVDPMTPVGGFILFKKTPTTPNYPGIQMRTPVDFGKLLSNATLMATLQMGLPRNYVLNRQMGEYFMTNLFLRDAIAAYDPVNALDPDPRKNYLSLARTPMLTLDKDRPYVSTEVAMTTPSDPGLIGYTPANPKALLKFSLVTAKSAPNQLLPMNTPQVPLSFDPMNPDITAFLASKRSSDEWIRNRIYIPGLQIATRPIDPSLRDALSSGMQALVQPLLNTPQKQTNFQNLVMQLNGETLSMQRYAKGLFEGTKNFLGLNGAQLSQTATSYDALLLQLLPPQEQRIIQSNAILFARTNSQLNGVNLYFCSYFNPRTGEAALGQIDQNKNNLTPLDERSWVNYLLWEIDTTP